MESCRKGFLYNMFLIDNWYSDDKVLSFIYYISALDGDGI